VVLPKTINITIDYLRSGRTVDTFARGVITRHGRRVANVRVEAWQDDPERPIAIAYAHFLIMSE
jgi:acyl-coenzyme A thioesterase PaaI-like protein